MTEGVLFWLALAYTLLVLALTVPFLGWLTMAMLVLAHKIVFPALSGGWRDGFRVYEWYQAKEHIILRTYAVLLGTVGVIWWPFFGMPRVLWLWALLALPILSYLYSSVELRRRRNKKPEWWES